MSRRFSLLVLVSFFVLLSYLWVEPIKNFVLSSTAPIKKGVAEFSIKTPIDKYLNQVSTIESLTTENEKLKEQLFAYKSYKTKLEEIEEQYKINRFSTKVEKTTVLSYSSFGDPFTLWIDKKEHEDEKIYGVLYKDKAIGIAINNNGNSQALLHGNPKCHYAVHIGKNKAPAIIKSIQKEEEILANYIPYWMDIKVGDEVITSGLDNIFFAGVKVGKVISVQKQQGYKQAKISPYESPTNPKYLYLITKSK